MYCLNISSNGYLVDTLYCRTSSIARQISNAFKKIYKDCLGKEVSCHTYKLLENSNRKVIFSKEQISFDIDLKLLKTDTDRLFVIPNIKLYYIPSDLRIIEISDRQYTVRVPLDKVADLVDTFDKETLSQSIEFEMFQELLNILEIKGGTKHAISI